MPVTKRDLDWVAAELLPEIHNQNRKQVRVRHRLASLLNELNPMKIRITEPVFFFGQQREEGEVMEAPVGPYKSVVGAGGLTRVPQFVELPHEIHVTEQTTTPAPAATVPPAVTLTTAPVSPVKVAPKANPVAARIRALTTRRAKFEDSIANLLAPSEAMMTKLETDAPAILEKASENASDQYAAIEDLASAMNSVAAGSNGGE